MPNTRNEAAAEAMMSLRQAGLTEMRVAQAKQDAAYRILADATVNQAWGNTAAASYTGQN